MFFANKFKSVLGGAMCAAALFASSAMAADDVLLVGTESSYAPFEFIDKEGKLVGFDIDLTEAVAKEMGVTVQWMQMPFDGLIPAMLTSQVDMAVASFTVTEERAKRVNFSTPYYKAGLSFVVRNADAQKYPNTDSLTGKRLCAQLGSVSAMKAEKLSPGNTVTFSDAYAAYLELQQGGCEAVINDRPVNLYFMATSKAAENSFEVPGVLDAEDMAMVIPKNNKELLDKVNAALQKLKDNGTYQAIYDKWFTAKK